MIRAWKDPDARTDGMDIDHPAGDIELDYVGGSIASIILMTLISYCQTCLPSCQVTNSTCNCDPNSWC
jgi:hypothetical protein